MQLKDFVKHFKNPINKQEKLEISKLKLKEAGISVDDLLEIKFNKKFKKFEE